MGAYGLEQILPNQIPTMENEMDQQKGNWDNTRAYRLDTRPQNPTP